jgi:hypothetical protein
MNEQDATPAYDIYVEEDRVTFVRRPEPTVESDPDDPVSSGLRFVPILMLASHGLIALLALALTAYLTLVPATAEVYALASGVPAIARVYALPAITMSKSETVPTTGRVHVPASQAHGWVTFYNGLLQPQTIAAGTLLIGSDGEQVVTDETAYVPAGDLTGNGQAAVWAHALNPGPEGNIKAGDITGPCCKPLIQAVNAAFSGGHDEIDYQAVTKADISTATTTDLDAQLQHSLAGRMAPLPPPGGAVLTPVPCTTHTASSKPVGAQAQQVTVTVTRDCTPAAYNASELERDLASLIAGKTTAQARAILLKQRIKEAGIRLSWLRDRLPININQIKFVLVFHWKESK